ncbi:MAG: DUF3604 domain-containing protein, partial [Bacillota bacterium]
MEIKKAKKKNMITKIVIVSIMLIVWLILSINPKVMFNNKMTQLWINSPSYVETNEEFLITVQAWDWSERLAKSYKGEVSFDIISYDLDDYSLLSNTEASLPEATKFKGTSIGLGGINPELISKDVGFMEFDMKINTEGIHYIAVEDNSGFRAISNPIIALNDNNKALLWGDIHTHSVISDGAGLPGALMKFARDTALLDFYSLTDHGEGFGINTKERAQWQIDYNFNKTEKYNKPGEFVTFHGVEWTTSFGQVGKEFGYGHYTLVSDATAPVLAARGKQQSSDELWEYLDTYTQENDANVIAIPHHLTQTNFEMDWFAMNPEYVKTVSVFSVHGDSSLPNKHQLNYMGTVHAKDNELPGASAIDAFKMGHKVAIVANSDSHDGHPGHPICHKGSHYPNQYPVLNWIARGGHPYPGGLTGVYLNRDEFNRKGIMQEIRNGSVVATRAPFRPVIDFSINGMNPGQNNSTLQVPDTISNRDIRVQVLRDGLELGWQGNAQMDEWQDLTIEIWKNSELWHVEKSSSPIIDFLITDNE